MYSSVFFLESLGRASLAVWWLPLAAWSVAAAIGYLLLRRWRTAHPHVQVLAHQALLFALPLAFVVAALVPLGAPLAPVAAASQTPADVHPGPYATQVHEGSPVDIQAAPPLPAPDPSPAWGFVALGTLVALAAVLALMLLLRLGLQSLSVRRYAHLLPRHIGREVHLRIAALAPAYGIRRPVRVVRGSPGDVPMTFGWLHPTIILPPALLHDAEGLDLSLRHELAHIARDDYAWNLVEACVAYVFAASPVSALLRRRIDQHREAVCDHTVLSAPSTSLRRYASLLLSFQHVTPRQGVHALRMAKPGDDLKQRILTMQSFRHIPFSRSLRSQRWRVTAALLLLPMLLTACQIDFSAFSSDDSASEELERLELEVAYLKDRINSTTDMVRHSTLSAMYQEAVYEYEALRMEMEIDAQLNRREVVIVERRPAEDTERVQHKLQARMEVIQQAIEATSAELFDFYVRTPDAQQNPAAHPFALERTQRLEQLKRELQVISQQYEAFAGRQIQQAHAVAVYEEAAAGASGISSETSNGAAQALLRARATILNRQVESLQARIAEIEMGLLEMRTRSAELSDSQQQYLDNRTQQGDKLRAQMEALVMELAELEEQYRRN